MVIEHPHGLSHLADLSYDANVPCVCLRWNGYVTSAQFRRISDETLTLLKAHRAVAVLNDTTELPIIGAEDQEWVRQDFLSRGMAHGWRACAMVNSRFYFNRVAVDNVVRTLDPDRFTVEYFQNATEARAWLKALTGG